MAMEGAALIAALASAPARSKGLQSGDTLRAGERAVWRRARVRDGRPSGARRWAFDSGSTRSATARPREAGTRPTCCVTSADETVHTHVPALPQRNRPGLCSLRRDS